MFLGVGNAQSYIWSTNPQASLDTQVRTEINVRNIEMGERRTKGIRGRDSRDVAATLSFSLLDPPGNLADWEIRNWSSSCFLQTRKCLEKWLNKNTQLAYRLQIKSTL